jgi:hypothetical protein
LVQRASLLVALDYLELLAEVWPDDFDTAALGMGG